MEYEVSYHYISACALRKSDKKRLRSFSGLTSGAKYCFLEEGQSVRTVCPLKLVVRRIGGRLEDNTVITVPKGAVLNMVSYGDRYTSAILEII